jgi:hypothetical protein
MLRTWPAASDTIGAMVWLPTDCGVPESVVPVNDKPAGSGMSGDCVIEYGGTPPAILKVNE